ncbi:MFS transporter [Rhodococcus globerulus]|uniref:MFS transporter n=1 Tax=Rhodococcus globerulus TaxID=33008 RepID=UPI001F315AC0|nr:MFS transporter [Rhodococcus globerulus]
MTVHNIKAVPDSAADSIALTSRGTARSSRTVVLVLALCGIVMTLQQTMILPLLPNLPSLLDTSASNASWLVTVTLVTGAVVTPLIGRLADMFGKKRMIMITLMIVVTGSVLGGATEAFPLLIIARAMQGCGLAMVPVATATMRDVLPRERVPGGIATMSASLAIGSAAGLPLAGIIVNSLDWHAVFWVTALSGSLLFIVIAKVVPESGVQARTTFDYIGAFVLAAALISLLLVLSKGSQWGWSEWETLSSAGMGIFLLVLWVPLQLRSPSPLVDVRLAARPPVLLVNTCSALIGFALFSNFLVTIQLLQMPVTTGFGIGMNILEAGLWMIPTTLAGVVMAPVASRAIGRFGARSVLLIASIQLSVSFVVRVFFSHTLWQILVGATLIGMGLVLTGAAIQTLIMRAVPISETASANGLNALLRSIGTSAASATLAAMSTIWVVQAGSEIYPAYNAFAAMFWISAAATVATAATTVVMMFFTRRSTDRKPTPSTT